MRRQVAVGGVFIAWLGLVVAGCSGSRAPFGLYNGPYPAPGAITAFDSVVWYPRDETKAGAPPFLKPNSINPGEAVFPPPHLIGNRVTAGPRQ